MIPLTPERVPALLRETLADPRAVAEEMGNWRASRAVLWQGLIAAVVLNVLVLQLENLIRPFPAAPYGALFQNPLMLGVAQAGFAVLTVFGTFWIGRMFGGRGRFDTTILYVTWLQVIALAIQVVQLLVLLLIPALYGLIGVIGFGLSLWLFVNFVAVLHGFQSLGLVFAGIFGSVFAMAFVLSLLLSLIGFAGAPGGGG